MKRRAMNKTRKPGSERSETYTGPRVRLRLGASGFRVETLGRPPRGQRKTFDLDRPENEEYRQWFQTGEACAYLERTPDMLRRYKVRGLLRSVRVYRHDPRRWHCRYDPRDIHALAARLRAEESARRQRRAVRERLARVATSKPGKKPGREKAKRLPGPEEFGTD